MEGAFRMGQLEIVKDFFLGISRSRVSLIGAMIVTVTTPLLVAYMLTDTIFHIKNPYFGGAVYLLLGPTFLFGLALIFIGAFLFRGDREIHLFTFHYMRKYFTEPELFGRLRRNIFLIVLLTSINFAVFSVFLYRAYHYMESTQFCGQFCHTVMNPEYTAYQNSPHSRVTCVECHIGSGADWFVKSKISGARQLVAVALDTYPRPIETPVHGLRPARDTCESCHRPETFHGENLLVKDKILEDENNTQVKTVLLMKIGTAGDRSVSPSGIHWHVAPENKITYKATDRKRMVIPEINLARKDGTSETFKTPNADEQISSAEHVEVREMDCIDCHNRPTHIYLPADKALDRKILSGKIPVELPYIKKMGMQVITREYESQEQAKSEIEQRLQGWYGENYPQIVANKPELLAQAIQNVQNAYVENVFPDMNIVWGTYTDHRGHNDDFGCFRCHDEEHESSQGVAVTQDCDTCHTILAEEEEAPEILKTLGIE
jgi:nitrate/TMAO reductase-like tetraheme cytochrome c subunit